MRDEETIETAAQDATAIYHLAAAVGVKKIVSDPLESLETNLSGTENVLSVAACEGIPTFVASSSEVYGKSTDIPFSEDDDRVLGPTTVIRWGYATAKAIDESLALAYHNERDLPVVIGRFFNVVGPRQTGEYGMVIPRFIDQALNDEPITVYGDGTQTRCFMDVRDAVESITGLMDSDATTGEVFNIGAADPISINHLAELIVDHADSDSPIEHIPFDEVYGDDFEEPTDRVPDTSKLHSVLGKEPETSIETIVDDIITEQKK